MPCNSFPSSLRECEDGLSPSAFPLPSRDLTHEPDRPQCCPQPAVLARVKNQVSSGDWVCLSDRPPVSDTVWQRFRPVPLRCTSTPGESRCTKYQKAPMAASVALASDWPPAARMETSAPPPA